MTKKDQKNNYKKFVLFVVGFFVLVLGITLTLVWWKDVVGLFRGSIGVILSLAGLFALYAINTVNR